MKKALLLFVSFLFLFAFTKAQEIDRCGSDLYLQQVIQKDPSYLNRINEARDEAKQWRANNPSDTRSTYVIPVVVHVVYHTTSQNITDAQVQSQIDVLNEDYNRLNADTSKTPDAFKPVAGEISVKFCLAAFDPNGYETNGITRTSTDVIGFQLGDSVKSTELGGEDPWPASKYLNIWVCNLTNNVLGYATMPLQGSPSSNDGVVIRYNAFGREGLLKPPFTKGRTCTHEVGHWLGLYHTFEGGCSDGDDCSDTPPEAQAIYNCPTFPHISCDNGPNGDMFMNYMDYTDDGCMNMFTQCQCGIMESVLADPSLRKSIQNSPGGCQGVAYNLDASISTVVFPDDTLHQQGFYPIVQVTNRGADDITYVKINYQVDGQTVAISEYNGTLVSLASAVDTLPVYFTGEGGHVFYAWTSEPNHGVDEFIYNDTSSASFTVRSDVPKNTTSITPNLTGNILVLQIQNPSAATMHLQLVNPLGQIKVESDFDVFDNSIITLDLSDLDPQLYILYGQVGYDFVKEKIMLVR